MTFSWNCASRKLHEVGGVPAAAAAAPLTGQLDRGFCRDAVFDWLLNVDSWRWLIETGQGLIMCSSSSFENDLS